MAEDLLQSESLKKRLYTIIFKADTPVGKAFDVVLILCILSSVAVVMLDSIQEIHDQYRPAIIATEWFFTILFTIEYVFRLYCVPFKLKYARSFFGLVDLLAILPTYLSIFFFHSRYLAVIRVLRVLRVFRVLKLGNHMAQAQILRQALYNSRQKILVFICTVLTLVVIIGSLMYMIEGPEHDFTSIPKSIYWAVVTMTTVGYGDISPQTAPGQCLAAIVMILGYSIIAVPTGIVTVELGKTASSTKLSSKICPNCGKTGLDPQANYCFHCGTKL